MYKGRAITQQSIGKRILGTGTDIKKGGDIGYDKGCFPMMR